MKTSIKQFWNNFLEFLFPSSFKCTLCGREVEKGQLLCSDCQENAPFNSGKRCARCDQPIFDDSDICDFCKQHRKSFDKAFSPFKYEGSAKQAVINLKSDNAKYLAPKMAKFMAQRCLDERISPDVIIPVPLSPKTLARRGYNQSLLLAEEIGKLLNVKVDKESLIKIKETKHQKELSFSDRQNNLSGAFKLSHGKFFTGKTILLVDDVITTGATANECAKLLKKYAKHVYVTSFARSPYKNL